MEEITFREGGGVSVWGGCGRAVGGGKLRNQLSGGFQGCASGWLPPPHLHPIGSPPSLLCWSVLLGAQHCNSKMDGGWDGAVCVI